MQKLFEDPFGFRQRLGRDPAAQPVKQPLQQVVDEGATNDRLRLRSEQRRLQLALHQPLDRALRIRLEGSGGQDLAVPDTA